MTRNPSYILRNWQVVAALDGRLKAIVVPMNPQPQEWPPLPPSKEPDYMWSPVGKNPFYNVKAIPDELKPYLPGDVIAGKEAFTLLAYKNIHRSLDEQVSYRLGSEDYDAWRRWSPAQTMPRWACRIWLIVKDVRPVRVWEMNGPEIVSLGTNGNYADCDLLLCDKKGKPIGDQLRDHWQSRHGKKYPWESNPWAWYYTLDMEVKR